MKNVTHNTDHLSRMKSRLLEQYQGKPRMEAILTAWAAEIQAVEDAAFELYVSRMIQNHLATGDLLDKLGGLVGQQRQGFTDPVYEILITARIQANRSDGKRSSIARIAGLLVPGEAIEVREYDGAMVVVPRGPVTIPPDVIARDFLRRAVLAGVRMTFVWTELEWSETLLFGSVNPSVTPPTAEQSLGSFYGGIDGGKAAGAFTYDGGKV